MRRAAANLESFLNCRGRGLGRALLARSFGLFRAHGLRACGLNTDSRTGALSFYEGIGMRVRRSYAHHAKELSGSTPIMDSS